MEITGTYGTAIIYADDLEPAAEEQIRSMMNHPSAEAATVRIMPDVHKGKGCVIGYTANLTDRVVPNLIGVDIGCGVIAWNLGSTAPDFRQVEDTIRASVPHGFHVRESVYELIVSVFEQLGVGLRYHEFVQELTNLPMVDEQRLERVMLSIGTLGGGNHFIEINIDESGDYWLVIHSGSRSLGLVVAEYHQTIAEDQFRPEVPEFIPDIKQIIADSKEKGEEHLIQSRIDSAKKLIALTRWKPTGLEYLTGKLREDYFEDMKLAQLYAQLNRRVMGHAILEGLGMDYATMTQIESTHNYISFEDNVIRKGAISARKDEMVLIPLNMKDGTILGRGKGNPEWNYSAAHGAGRRLSRRRARREIDLEEFKAMMTNVWSESVSEATIDEAPPAYKPAEDIVKLIEPSVDVISVMNPCYNFKSDIMSDLYD